MWKRLNSNQMCVQFSYKEVFLIKRFLIERFYCIYIYIIFILLIDIYVKNNIFRYNIKINNYYNDPTKTINDIECNYVNNINLATINDKNIFTSI